MIIANCTSCGRVQEWKTGVVLGEAEIEIAGTTVFCGCGSVIQEEDGVLREYFLDVTDAKASLVPVGEPH